MLESVMHVKFVLTNCDLDTGVICDVCSGVCPYLALETCRHWRGSTKTVALMKNGKIPTISIEQVQANYFKVISILGDSYENVSGRSKGKVCEWFLCPMSKLTHCWNACRLLK